MDINEDITIPYDITHHTGLKFQVNILPEEVERIKSDVDYAKRVADTYYQLHLSGLFSKTGGAGANQHPETDEEEGEVLDKTTSSVIESPCTSRASSRVSGTSSTSNEISVADKCFLETIQNLPKPKEVTATQGFCLRLADGLEKLPPRISNQLQVEFLSRLTEMENTYLYDE